MSDVWNLFVRYLRYASPFEGGSAKGIPLGGDDFEKNPLPLYGFLCFSVVQPFRIRSEQVSKEGQ